MRVVLLSLVAISAAVPVAFGQDAPTGLGVTDVEFTIEALALSRSDTSTPFLQNFDLPGSPIQSTSDLAKFGTAAGIRLGLSGSIDGPWGFEASSFFAGFSRSGAVVSPGENLDSAYSVGVVPGNMFFGTSTSAYYASFIEQSLLGSGELNATYDLGGAKLLFGPRAIYYSSNLSSYFSDDISSFNGGGGGGNERVSIDSINRLFGAQIGIEGMYQASDTFSFGGRATAGLYGNLASLNRSYSDDNAGNSPIGASASSAVSATGLAESFELSPKVALALAPKLDLEVGGTILLLNGIDEASNHFAGIGTPGGAGTLGSDAPGFHNGVNFAGVSVGLRGHF